MKYIKLLLFILLASNITGQNTYDIKNPQNNYKKCSRCIETLRTMPEEVQMGIKNDMFGNLYFIF